MVHLVNVYEPGPLEGRLAQWPVLATAGAVEVRLAETEAEVEAAQHLRYRVFYEEMTAIPSPAMRELRRDFDRFDPFCDHLLVIDRSVADEEGQPSVVGTYRLMRDTDAARAGGFYTSGEYDIGPMLEHLRGRNLVELGRSCILREYRSKPSTMQLLWRGVMVYDLRFSIDLMFGCASLAGTDPEALALPLSYLHHFHRMAEAIRVRARSELYVEMDRMAKEAIDPKSALHALPPMIKGYLRAGASIGDGAVIDRQFDTTDVLIYFPLSNMDERYRSRFSRDV
ncbi:MAG: GNAT family N-acetyltransferase [Alphaproteobacteria bacterium]|nr:GNAT family N-acetyltransferase [Alphaproteobacteria bacterium]MBV9063473.1 GNAT family N-acetyltransferase [Alphaproteobacteria bacterium]